MALFDFQMLARSVTGLTHQVKQLRGEIETLQQQREDMATAAPAREEVKAMIRQWIDSRQGEFNKAMQITFGRFKHPGWLDSDEDVSRHVTVLGVRQMLDAVPGTGSMDDVMCGLFGPQILQAFSAGIDAMPWPGEGLPRAKRKVELERLDQKIADLIEQADVLRRKALDAGIVIE